MQLRTEGFDSVGTDDFKSMTDDMDLQVDANTGNKSILTSLKLCQMYHKII